MKLSGCYEHFQLVRRPDISYWPRAFEPRQTLPFPVLLYLVRSADLINVLIPFEWGSATRLVAEPSIVVAPLIEFVFWFNPFFLCLTKLPNPIITWQVY